MRESVSAPQVSVSRLPCPETSGDTPSANNADILKTAIQIQVQVEALTTTAQAAAKQARLLTQFVSTLGEPKSDQDEDYRTLRETNETLSRDLQRAHEERDAWKMLAQNVQEMQAMAMAAFERCNALDKENVELRQAMHAFAEGSASATVQELQKIIAGLTEEVAQYKQREEDLKSREKTLRNKENNSLIKAMRKQTKELKRRSLQKTLEGKDVKDLAVLGTKGVNTNVVPAIAQPKPMASPELASIPTFQEFFFL